MVNNKGKLCNESLHLILSEGNSSKQIKKIKVNPLKSGVYCGALVLNDSLGLKLDKNYRLQLDGKNVFLAQNFRVEDYELKSSGYEVRALRYAQYGGESNALFLKGADENGLNLLDVRTEISLKTQSVGITFDSAVFVPDTLWSAKVSLDPAGETRVNLPDSIFPKANLKYKAIIVFLTSSNERIEKSLDLEYICNEEKLDIHLAQDSVLFTFKRNNRDIRKPGIVRGYVNSELVQEQAVYFPYVCRLNAFITRYEADADTLKASLSVSSESALVSCSSQRDADSVRIQIANPRKLPVLYYVYRLNKEIMRGDETNLSVTIPNRTVQDYFLSLHYLWNNEVIDKNYNIPLSTNKLNVSVSQPEYIYPGQKVPVTVRVTDYKNRPVEDADILAYGLTTKFPNTNLPVIPEFKHPRKARTLINAFYLKQNYLNSSVNLWLNWNKWNPRMQLDTIAYFNFLHPPKGRFLTSFSIADTNQVLLSPYVIKNGFIQNIYAVYINERLVFSSLSNLDIPYVFEAAPGKNSVRIRYPFGEMIFSNLYLQKGRKYILSLETDSSNHQITLIKRPYKLADYELTKLSQTCMVIKKNYKKDEPAYVSHFSRVYPLKLQRSFDQDYIVGPMTPNTLYRYNYNGIYSIQEEFEPGYRYQFQKDLVKMKELNKDYWKSYLQCRIPSISFEDTMITEEMLQAERIRDQKMKQASYKALNNPSSTEEGFGCMKLSIPFIEKGWFIKNVLLFKNGSPEFIRLYEGTVEEIHQLAKGNYRAFILNDANDYLEADSLPVNINGLNLFKVNGHWHRADSISLRFNALILDIMEKGYSVIEKGNKPLRTIRNDYFRYRQTYQKGDVLISGYVKEATTLEPIPGVNIILEGTTTGVVSDIDGHYMIYVPKGPARLIFSFIGYMTENISVGASNLIDVLLVPDVKKLEEVVVIGYGVQKKLCVTGSMARVNSQSALGAFPGLTAGVRVRGISALTVAKPMIIVDGMPLDADLSTINPADIASAEVLKSDLTHIYGARAANGVILIITRNGKGIAGKLPTSLNKALSDEAYLESLANATSIRTHFSDEAFWFPALTTDGSGKATFTVSFPEDITSWKTNYVAMRKTMSGTFESQVKAFKPLAANLALARFLIEGDSVAVIGKALNYGTDTLKVHSHFEINGESKEEHDFSLINSAIDTLGLIAGIADSVKITYLVKQDKGFSDGERRCIPIHKQGTLESEGQFATLQNDTAFVIILPKNWANIAISAESNMLNVLRTEIHHVNEYPYLCNEQASSKLKCLLMEKKICSFIGEKFRFERDVNQLIKKLVSSCNSDFLWGWWKDTPNVMWISLQVLDALTAAQKEGYTVELPTQEIIDKLMILYPSLAPEDKIRTLRILHALKANMRADLEVEQLLRNKSIKYPVRLEALELMQLLGEKVKLDTLLAQKKETIFGNYYWKADSFDIAASQVMTTLSMYRIIRNDSTHSQYLPGIRNYLMEERKDGYWRNTYESARIIETILPDFLQGKNKPDSAELTVENGRNSVTTRKFPFVQTCQPGDTLRIHKKGDFPVYFSVFSKYWNSKPEPVQQGFSVETSFDGNAGLIAGNPVKLRVDVTVGKQSDFVMIEVPIPAGCSYETKKQSLWTDHREYFTDKVSIFCNRLNAGKYTYYIELIPRYTGRYHLNPARVERMYFPIFYGRNEMKKVAIAGDK